MINKFLKPAIAEQYDAYYISDTGQKIDNIEQDLMTKLMVNIPRTKMLELGCGTGHWTNHFTNLGFDVTGIDTSEAMLNEAKRKNINADFLSGNAENLPYDSESIDVISSITMMEFVEDQTKVFKEINRVLKKGGWLILGCLNAKSILAKTKDQAEEFRQAQFLNVDEIKAHVIGIGTPNFDFGVYMKEDFSLHDTAVDKMGIEPVFIGCVLQKQ